MGTWGYVAASVVLSIAVAVPASCISWYLGRRRGHREAFEFFRPALQNYVATPPPSDLRDDQDSQTAIH